MAAPLGFKNFVTGDVLTAADTNGYLMQGVWTFANSAARTAAVTSPQEGNVSFLKDTNALEIYDGAAWVAYGSGDITGVTAGTGISGGGTSGDVTITNSMATAIDAKGDLIAGTGADTFSRLAVGSNDTVLTADSSTATGLKWAAVAAGGMTLLASGTLSGSTVTIPSISGSYNNLILYLRNFYRNTSAGDVNIEISPTTSIVGTLQSNRYGTSLNTTITAGGGFTLCYQAPTTDTKNSAVVQFFDYAATTSKKFTTNVYVSYNGTTNEAIFTQGINTNSSAMTQISIVTGTSFGGGTYALYGVK